MSQLSELLWNLQLGLVPELVSQLQLAQLIFLLFVLRSLLELLIRLFFDYCFDELRPFRRAEHALNAYVLFVQLAQLAFVSWVQEVSLRQSEVALLDELVDLRIRLLRQPLVLELRPLVQERFILVHQVSQHLVVGLLQGHGGEERQARHAGLVFVDCVVLLQHSLKLAVCLRDERDNVLHELAEVELRLGFVRLLLQLADFTEEVVKIVVVIFVLLHVVVGDQALENRSHVLQVGQVDFVGRHEVLFDSVDHLSKLEGEVIELRRHGLFLAFHVVLEALLVSLSLQYDLVQFLLGLVAESSGHTLPAAEYHEVGPAQDVVFVTRQVLLRLIVEQAFGAEVGQCSAIGRDANMADIKLGMRRTGEGALGSQINSRFGPHGCDAGARSVELICRVHSPLKLLSMQFTAEELNELVNIEQAKRLLSEYQLSVNDFPYSKWTLQELAMRIGDTSLYEKCFDHITKSPNNRFFQFVYKHLDQDFNYNCLQLQPCLSCYVHTNNIEQNLDGVCQSDRPHTIVCHLPAIYEISEIKVDRISDQTNIHIALLSNKKDFKPVDSIHLENHFQPPLKAQALSIEFKQDQSSERLMGRATKHDLVQDAAFSKVLTIKGEPTLDLEQVEISSEQEVQILQGIVAQYLAIKQEKLQKLQEMLKQLECQYNGRKSEKESGKCEEMMCLYKKFNQSAVLVELYQNKLNEYYGISSPRVSPKFSDCLECSRRYLQNVVVSDELMLRRTYFSEELTHKERDIVIDRLKPKSTFTKEILESELNETQKQELELFCRYNLSQERRECLRFIKEWFAICQQKGFTHILKLMLIQLISLIRQYKSEPVSQLLSLMQVEGLSPSENILNRVFLEHDGQLHDQAEILIEELSKVDKLMALNLILGVLGKACSYQYFRLLDNISAGNWSTEIVEYILSFLKQTPVAQNHRTKCIQVISKCWKSTRNQLKNYIALEQVCIGMPDLTLLEQHMLNEIYILLKSNLQGDEVLEVLTYLTRTLISQPLSIMATQRITGMIHSMLNQRENYMIYVKLHQNLEPYQVNFQNRQYSSSEITTFKELRRRLMLDESLDPTLVINFIVNKKHLIDNENLKLDSVYKKFNLGEQREIIPRGPESYFAQRRQRERESRQLEVLVSVQGIINLEQNLQTITQINDPQTQQMEQHMTQLFEKHDLKGFFHCIHQLLHYDKRFMSTIQKLISILKFACVQDSIKSLIINNHGIILLTKVYLKDPSETLMDLIEQILLQSQTSSNGIRRRLSEQIDKSVLNQYDSESTEILGQIFQNLEKQRPNQNQSIIHNRTFQVFCQIIPFLIRNLEQPAKFLINYFLPQLDVKQQCSPAFEIFGEIMFQIPVHYYQLRHMVNSTNIFDEAYQVCVNPEFLLTPIQESCYKIVTSIAKLIQQRQEQLLATEFIKVIFQNSFSTSEKVGNLAKICTNFLDFIKGEDSELYVIPELKKMILTLTEERNNRFKRATQNQQKKIKNLFKGSNFNNQLQQVQQEQGLVCVTCKEGYASSSNLLIVYLFTSVKQIPDETNFINSKGLHIKKVDGLSSVSYFQVVHYVCHKKAVQYELESRNAESLDRQEDPEWHAASKVNQAKCNCYFPIKNVNQNNIEGSMEQYFRKLQNRQENRLDGRYDSRIEGKRSWIILNDLRFLLIKIAKKEDLSLETGGGRLIHNIKLLPILMNGILQYDIAKYQDLLGVDCQNEDSITISLVLYLFFPLSKWQSDRKRQFSYAQDKEWLIRMYYLINLIMEKVISQLKPAQCSYFQQLDNHLYTEINKILHKLEEVEADFSSCSDVKQMMKCIQEW